MLIGNLNQNIQSECLLYRFKLSLISPKCPWKQYRQPENGRKIHDSSALFEPFIFVTKGENVQWLFFEPFILSDTSDTTNL